MKNFNTLGYSLENRVAIIKFNRPDAANGLNLEMATELALAAEIVANDTDIKAVILTGEGRFFCAGGDVKAMYDATENPGRAVRDIADKLHAALLSFAAMEAPLICAINGTAAGAGFSVAIAGDMVIAAESAKFTMAYSNIGLSPDGSSSYYLPRLVGLRKAQELMFSNTVLSATEALEWGLLNSVVTDETLMSSALELASTFVNGSKTSNGAIKQLLAASPYNSLENQLELESATIEACANGDDGREGVASFVEKRKPSFS